MIAITAKAAIITKAQNIVGLSSPNDIATIVTVAIARTMKAMKHTNQMSLSHAAELAAKPLPKMNQRTRHEIKNPSVQMDNFFAKALRPAGRDFLLSPASVTAVNVPSPSEISSALFCQLGCASIVCENRSSHSLTKAIVGPGTKAAMVLNVFITPYHFAEEINTGNATAPTSWLFWSKIS